MGQLLHGSARTTAVVRAAIQRSQESLSTLARRHHLNPKTVAKWRKRTTLTDTPMGPKPASTVLTPQQEAIAVAFREQTLLPLDDCLYALQATIPQLSRSALHRCFQRHGISRLPLPDKKLVQKEKFKDYPIGYLHIDFAEVHTQQGKLYLFVAVDRTSKVVFTQLYPRATKLLAADFLRQVLAYFPYKIHKILTDNGIQFGSMAYQSNASRHIFDRVCQEYGIEHRFTKPAHPWTNGQVERMNRTIKEATVYRFHYQTTDESNQHLQTILLAYNRAKRLKSLRGLTPHEFVCIQWQTKPTIFTRDPTQLTLELYNRPVPTRRGKPTRYNASYCLL